jgi:hypothetical protein
MCACVVCVAGMPANAEFTTHARIWGEGEGVSDEKGGVGRLRERIYSKRRV